MVKQKKKKDQTSEPIERMQVPTDYPKNQGHSSKVEIS